MQGRIKGFDGLRAIAVGLVYAYHSTSSSHLIGMDAGTLGVRVFFVLSGFLIIGILTRQCERIESGHSTFRVEIRAFYYRRALRIFPLYYAVLTLFATLHALGYFYDAEAGIPWHYVYLTNVYIGSVLHGWPVPFDHFWTLAIEEQFYLLSPPLLLLMPTRFHLRACVAIASIGFATFVGLAVAGLPDVTVKTFSISNFASMAIGGVAYFLFRNRHAADNQRPIVLIVLTVIAVVTLGFHSDGNVTVPLSSVVEQIVGIMAVGYMVGWIATRQDSVIVRQLEARWLVWIGVLSYEIYVLHKFVIYLDRALYPLLSGASLTVWHFAHVPSALALTVVAAMLSRRFIEEPFLRLKDSKRENGFSSANKNPA
jgi:peptidoglycan/LPS O-acetylase OafA/YrhL